MNICESSFMLGQAHAQLMQKVRQQLLASALLADHTPTTKGKLNHVSRY